MGCIIRFETFKQFLNPNSILANDLLNSTLFQDPNKEIARKN